MSRQELQARHGGAVGVAFLVASACALLVPSVAAAATVSADQSGGVSVKAAAGEVNTVTVSAESLGGGQQRTTFHDETTSLVAATGCAQATPNTVTCETTGSPAINVLLD